MASKQIKQDAQEFFNRVSKLQSKVEVSQSVNELLAGFKKRWEEKTLTSGTIKGYLSDYRELFEVFQHENPDLNETKQVKINGVLTPHTQHYAVSILVMDEELTNDYNEQKAKSKMKKLGIKGDGEIRDTSKIPKINVHEIIKQSLECLISEKPEVIACGVVNLTGLRISEQGMPRHEHKEAGLIEHTMVVLDEYMIGFRGVVKKRGADDALAFYARPTLVPAQKIVDAQERYLQLVGLKNIPTVPKKFSETFYQNIRKEYKDRFSASLSTLSGYDEEDNLVDENGSPHKGRSFYVCVLRSIARAKINRFNSATCIKVGALSLAQDSDTEVMGYFASYDEDLFIHTPDDILLSTNIDDYGKMKTPPVIPVKEAVKSFDIDNFKEGLEEGEDLKLSEFLRSGMSETQAILELFKLVRNQKPATKTAEKTDNQEVKEKPRSVIVSEIVEGIMNYNRHATEGNIKMIAIPSHGLINEIAKLKIGVTIAPTTVNTHFKLYNDALDKELKEMGIPEGMKDKVHNSVCLRGEFSKLAAKILEYIEPD